MHIINAEKVGTAPNCKIATGNYLFTFLFTFHAKKKYFGIKIEWNLNAAIIPHTKSIN